MEYSCLNYMHLTLCLLYLTVSAFVTHAVFPKQSWKKFNPQGQGMSRRASDYTVLIQNNKCEVSNMVPITYHLEWSIVALFVKMVENA